MGASMDVKDAVTVVMAHVREVAILNVLKIVRDLVLVVVRGLVVMLVR